MLIPSVALAARPTLHPVARPRTPSARRACAGVALLLAATIAGVATAAETTRSPTLPTGGHASEQFIIAWDTDGDGRVTKVEYDSTRTQRFAGADEDSTGSLNADEYVNEYAVRLDRQIAGERKASIEQTHIRFRSLDRDKDGVVSRKEYDASGERAFVDMDKDRDGRIAKDDPEATRMRPVAGNTRKPDETASPARQARPRSVIGMPSTHSRAGLIQIYDTDGDGIVTRAQYDEQRATAYKTTDTNSDGKLDENEYVDEFVDRLDRQIARNRQAQLKQGQVRFESIDADKNGDISREEYATMSTRMFDRTDTDRDGVVSRDDPEPVREQREGEARRASDRA